MLAHSANRAKPHRRNEIPINGSAYQINKPGGIIRQAFILPSLTTAIFKFSPSANRLTVFVRSSIDEKPSTYPIIPEREKIRLLLYAFFI
ncbi:hypothetical protein C6499_19205 [Candidatus Poribacteria bacterium]|nr:MAG: hypothetical protein C6499_19205 [Candidatus Poribacteria bacterium]